MALVATDFVSSLYIYIDLASPVCFIRFNPWCGHLIKPWPHQIVNYARSRSKYIVVILSMRRGIFSGAAHAHELMCMSLTFTHFLNPPS